MSSASTSPDSPTPDSPQTVDAQPRFQRPRSTARIAAALPFDRIVPPGVVADSDALDPALAAAVRAYGAMALNDDDDDQDTIPSPHPTFFIHDSTNRNTAVGDLQRLLVAIVSYFRASEETRRLTSHDVAGQSY